MLVEERFELVPGRLMDDVFGECRRQGRHVRSIPKAIAQEQRAHTGRVARHFQGGPPARRALLVDVERARGSRPMQVSAVRGRLLG
jgi:hypothetical protein